MGLNISTNLKVKGLTAKVRQATEAGVIALDDYTLEANSTGGAFALTLPALSKAFDGTYGAVYVVRLSTDNGDVTVVEHADDGAATIATLRDEGDTVILQATSATTWRTYDMATQSLNLSIPLTIALPFTLGNRSGVNSDGVLVGSLPHTAAGDVNLEDNSAGTFADDTTDFNDAGASDVALTQPFDTSDSLNIGYAARFCAVVLNVATAGSGDAVAAETIWEYSQGSDTWATLESGHELTDDSVALTAGTSTYVTSFVPPSDWATQAIDGGTAMYHVRFRATADDVYNTTDPLITQGWVVPLDTGDGITVPATGTVTAVDLQALTASATNDDTELLLVNITTGLFAQLTWTGADVMDRVTGLTLAVTKGDELAVVMISEDGTTEFASGQAIVQIDI